MTGKPLIVAMVAIVAIASASLYAVNAPPPAGVTLQNFRHCTTNMTREQVEGILGKGKESRVGLGWSGEGFTCTWKGNGGDVLIVFGRLAVGGAFLRGGDVVEFLSEPPDPCHIRLLRWVGLARK